MSATNAPPTRGSSMGPVSDEGQARLGGPRVEPRARDGAPVETSSASLIEAAKSRASAPTATAATTPAPRLLEGRVAYRAGGVATSTAFALDGETRAPGLSIEARVRDHRGGRRLEVHLVPDGELALEALTVDVAWPVPDDARIFANGYQSWTETRMFAPKERIRRMIPIARGMLAPFGDEAIFRARGGRGVIHGFTYGYVQHADGSAALAGSLDENGGYTILEHDAGRGRLAVQKDVAGLVIDAPLRAVDVLFLEGHEPEVVERYFDALEIAPREAKHRAGWTSWYHHYTHISEALILENVEAFARAKIPLELFQIDDGYQRGIGDWLEANEKFPSGMAALAKKIREAGFRPGIWIAPFICDAKSKLYAEHRDWIARDERGRLVKAGFNPLWSGTFYALDVDHPEVRAYVARVFENARATWGFELLKLDFLYAAALVQRKNKPRARAMREAMEWLRGLAGDALLLGCGVPLASAFGLVEYCRIGADVSMSWEERMLALIGARERLSTINSLQNTIARRHLTGRVWLNDPDVFVLRDEKNHLTRAQRGTLFKLNALFGALLFTSDDVRRYDDGALRALRSLFPLRTVRFERVVQDGPRLEAHFSIGARRYLCLASLGPRSVSFALPIDETRWSREAGFLHGAGTHDVAPFSTTIFHRVDEGPVALAGATGHVFPGAELGELVIDAEGVRVALDEGAQQESTLTFLVRDERQELRVNGAAQPVVATPSGARIVQVLLTPPASS